MDVCPRVSVLCCPVSVEALRRADPPVKESYQVSLHVIEKPIRVGQRSAKDCKCLLKKTLCVSSQGSACCRRMFRYRLSPETFGYTLVPPLLQMSLSPDAKLKQRLYCLS
jgi:hypothetical protein